jgi:S-(hydroxymethyl)glutathione dehydrogenase / alcohol dehydrogenase
MRIRAAVLHEPGRPVTVDEVELDEPRAREVLVRVAAAGVCHSDVHLADGVLGDGRWPMVLGHEGAGVVERVGDGVTHVREGDAVAFCFVPACGACRFCLAGKPNLCGPAGENAVRGTLLDGTSRLSLPDGTKLQHGLMTACFAERTVVAGSGVVPLPDGLPLWQAALLGCGVVTGFGAVRNVAGVRPGDSVAVFGCGGVGLNTIQAASMVGAGKIIAVDVNPQKLQWAEEFGATHVVDASKEDPVARVQALGGLGGVDFAFEVVGTQKTIEQAFASTHRGGTCVIVGVSPAGTRLSIDPGLLLQQRVLTGSSFGAGHQRTDVPLLIDLFMAGKYRLKEMVSRRLPLKELNHAFDLMKQGEVKRSVIVYE